MGADMTKFSFRTGEGIREVFGLVVVLLLAAWLRMFYLGTPFPSSDNNDLAYKILVNPGYTWMLQERYGVLINLYVKLFVGALSFLGVRITEFWWKFPIAFLGTAQIGLTFFLLKRMGLKIYGCLAGAFLMAVFPIHIFQSRYLWGYEVLGIFFATLAILKLVDFCKAPSLKTGLIASFFWGFYNISHGNILPFVLCVLAVLVIFFPYSDHPEILHLSTDYPQKGLFGVLGQCVSRIRALVLLFGRYRLWIFPWLFIPFLLAPIKHIFITRGGKSHLGFYFFDYFSVFVKNCGYPLIVLFLIVLLFYVFEKEMRSRSSHLFLICSAAYLMPFFFAIPTHGVTMVRGYVMIGIYFLILFVACVLDRLLDRHKRVFLTLTFVVVLLTFLGSTGVLFLSGTKCWRNGVSPERGTLVDPGSKAAGYLVRKYLPSSKDALSIHHSVERSNLYYYFGPKGYARDDMSYEKEAELFQKVKDRVALVICDPQSREIMKADARFHEKVVIACENEKPCVYLFVKDGVDFPSLQVSSADRLALNAAFEREYGFTWRDIFFQKNHGHSKRR